jgi:hypothetical protein
MLNALFECVLETLRSDRASLADGTGAIYAYAVRREERGGWVISTITLAHPRSG